MNTYTSMIYLLLPFVFGSSLLGQHRTYQSGRQGVNIDPSESDRFIGIAAGAYHTCSLRADGAVFCWGDNHFGQLGSDSSLISSHQMNRVAGNLRFSLIRAAGYSTCGLSDGHAYCWGANMGGNVGADDSFGSCDNYDEDENDLTHEARPTFSVPCVPQPARVGTDIQFRDLAMGDDLTCGISVHGELYCWGTNGSGEFGIGTDDSDFHYVPVRSGGDLPFQTISIGHGSGHVCGIAHEITYCWGWSGHGQLGIGDIPNHVCPSGGADFPCRKTPTLVAGGHRFVSVIADQAESCGIRSDARIYCWGEGYASALSERVDVEHCWTGKCSSEPVALDSTVFPKAKSMTMGTDHACALSVSGPIFCWGDTTSIVLGATREFGRTRPSTFADAPLFDTLQSGEEHICGLAEGAIYCWGSNTWGQVGNGSIIDQPHPVRIHQSHLGSSQLEREFIRAEKSRP